MEDVQNRPDERQIPLDRVGVTDLRCPIVVLDRAQGKQETVARLKMSVNLPHHFKGTHMSRFVEVLNEHRGEVTMRTLPAILQDLRKRFDAESAHIEVNFPYFLERAAPVSGLKALMDYECRFAGEVNGKSDDFVLAVRVPVTSLCPCSKEISDYGAHNQRGYVTIEVRGARQPDGNPALIWIEELIDIAEKSASAPVYPLLKREDERHVTMQAYDNPVFVEDIVRQVAARLLSDERIQWFRVEVVNQESIHNHSAFAMVEGSPSRIPQWQKALDIACKETDSRATGSFREVLKGRLSDRPREIPCGAQALRVLAVAIAYSQGARSSSVMELIRRPVFSEAFADFEPARVAGLHPEDVWKRYWRELGSMRFRSKVAAIISCGRKLLDIEHQHGSFCAYLRSFRIPQRIRQPEDIAQFWAGFDRLLEDLRSRGMPFFRSSTSLLQLLLDLDYDSVKPDLIVMRLARRIGMVEKEAGEPNIRAAARYLQEYALSRRTRAAAIDWRMLAFGGQTEAAPTLTKRFCSGPGPCSNHECPIGQQGLCRDYNRPS